MCAAERLVLRGPAVLAGAVVVEPGLPDRAHPVAAARPAARSRRARRRAGPRPPVGAPRWGAAPPRRRPARAPRPSPRPSAAPSRSQPICTIRVTPTDAARSSASATGRAGSSRPAGDVEVAVVVHDRVRQRLRQRRQSSVPWLTSGAPRRRRPAWARRSAGRRRGSPACAGPRRPRPRRPGGQGRRVGDRLGRGGTLDDDRHLAADAGLGPARRARSSGAAAYLLVGLGQLAAHRAAAVGRRAPRPSRPGVAWVRCGDSKNTRVRCVVGDRREPSSPLPRLARQEALEAEPVDGQPGDRERGEHGRGAGHAGHGDVALDGRGDQPVAGVGDARHPGVGDQHDPVARDEGLEQRLGAEVLVALEVGDDPARDLDRRGRRPAGAAAGCPRPPPRRRPASSAASRGEASSTRPIGRGREHAAVPARRCRSWVRSWQPLRP